MFVRPPGIAQAPIQTKVGSLHIIPNIDVCICTYRRHSLINTLKSCAQQELRDALTIRVVVADNDETPSAEALVISTCEALGLAYHYIHAPARNISVARNAALDSATAPLVAFIDDDEIATPSWLESLLRCRDRTGAMIVLGLVQAVYPPAPTWLVRADLHSIRPVFRKAGKILTGYTCNVLLDREKMSAEMRTCRFDPALGRSGGEDTFFFHQLTILGATWAYAPEAIVHEPVAPGRAKLAWLLHRSFRSGQTHARVMMTQSDRRVPMFAVATCKLLACVLGTGLGVASPGKWRRMAVRAALHAGAVARILGVKDVTLY